MIVTSTIKPLPDALNTILAKHLKYLKRSIMLTVCIWQIKIKEYVSGILLVKLIVSKKPTNKIYNKDIFCYLLLYLILDKKKARQKSVIQLLILQTSLLMVRN